MSYLNTCPLIWGLVHGPQRDIFNLRFELPAQTARAIQDDEVDLGLIPTIELFRQGLRIVGDVCISSDGPVRSIFLLHRVPLPKIRSLALDSSSRTSVALAKILLAELYGVRPSEREFTPDPVAMLSEADAALIIGDPALRVDLAPSEFEVLDLGQQWQLLTDLPMVYAVWAGKTVPPRPEIFRESYEYGRARISEIVTAEAGNRHIPEALAERYLTKHIQYDLSPRALKGLEEFKRFAHIHGLL